MLTSQINAFLATLYEDSAFKGRLMLGTLAALVLPTAVLVALGVPEKAAYLTMAALILPFHVLVYSLRKSPSASGVRWNLSSSGKFSSSATTNRNPPSIDPSPRSTEIHHT